MSGRADRHLSERPEMKIERLQRHVDDLQATLQRTREESEARVNAARESEREAQNLFKFVSS